MVLQPDCGGLQSSMRIDDLIRAVAINNLTVLSIDMKTAWLTDNAASMSIENIS